MKKKVMIITSSVTAILFSGIIVSGYLFVRHTNKQLSTYALPNTTFENINLEKKTKGEITKIVDEKLQSYDQTAVTIVVDGKSKVVSWKDLGVAYEGKDIANDIFASQTTGEFNEKLATLQSAENGTYKNELHLTPVPNENKVREFVDTHYSTLLSKPKNATIVRTNGKFQVVPSTDGKQVNKVELVKQILASFEGKTNKTIEAPLQAVRPTHTTEKMREVDLNPVIAQYRTSFANRASASITNAKLGGKYLDGILLAPGEEFSFIQEVGKSTADRGFVESGVYVNGEVSTGVGGGICQVSSTLYNAALLADLDITERRNHSRPVAYVPLGLDATVSDYAPDLRFKNNTGNFIFISAHSNAKELVVNIHGTPTGKEVTLYSKVDEKTDEYIKASAYKKVVQNGTVISDKRISRSTYKVG